MDKSGIVDRRHKFLASCSVSPMCRAALDAEIEFARTHHELGILTLFKLGNVVAPLRRAASELMDVNEREISFIKNSAEGLCIVANGYPFRPGDEIISYTHEYPSNVYPWSLQERRGVVVKRLPNCNLLGPVFDGCPLAWSMKDLEQLITPRTRVIALSHVQFTSGYAADLEELSDFCRKKNIDLVLDAAQSLGCMPLFPEKLGIAAVISSGWKWLLGPLGTGILYASPQLREKLEITLAGADMMKQGDDYLNHDWDPLDSGVRFEYSTTPFGLGHALGAALSQVILHAGIDSIWSEVKRLHSLMRDKLSPAVGKIAEFPERHRSGIMSIKLNSSEPERIVKTLRAQNIVVTARGGFLRLAPHFYVTDEEIEEAVGTLNAMFK